MEVTVMDTGDLPAGTIISFHTGSIRRHTQMEKNKAISLSCASGSEPVRVDLMSQIGTHTFEMVDGQDTYDVPICEGDSKSEVKLKVQIRPAKGEDEEKEEEAVEGVNGSPVKKLQTALMMRSYLDNHDVLRQMQELLQEMVTHRPEDPIDYMIQRLEQVCRDSKGVEVDLLDESQGEKKVEKKAAADDDEEEEEDDDDDCDVADLPPPPPPGVRKQRASVSEEAYGSFNERKAYEAKVIAKDDDAKKRIEEVITQCWMFKEHTKENLNVIIDAMSEKKCSKGDKLITQGDEGDVMWVIEQGSLECFKKIDGEEKLVKTCVRGDVFGELALLYNCPRAASVVAAEDCVLWELDRVTFKAICFEVAKGGQLSYEGFTAPGTVDEKAAEETKAAEPEKVAEPEKAAEEAKTAEEANPAEEAKPAEEDNDSGDELQEEPEQKEMGTKRREGVSAEAMGDDDGWEAPVYPKTPEEREQLSNIIRTSRDSKIHMLFGIVNKATFEKIVDACQLIYVKKDEAVIEQGAVGDYFYIVKSGDFDIWIQKGEEPAKKVFTAGVGFAFGELALMYNAPRSATIKPAADGEVWALDRTAFRNLVVRSSEAQFKQHVEFLNGIDIFQVLNEAERASLAEVLEEEEFADDEAIVEQDERDDKLFIIRNGQAVACIKGEQGEIEVMQYNVGNYFGEIALLSGSPRKASVYAVGACTCLYISRPTFLRVLGSLSSLLERNMSKYEAYQDAIQDGFLEGSEGAATDDKKQKRKRERKEENLADKIEKNQPSKIEKEEGGGEPETLKDKVAQDFKNLALVTPNTEFEVPDVHFMMFGGLILGQKFTMDKILHCRTPHPVVNKDEDDVYQWTAPTKLKTGTEIGVMCQKGQKSAADPTPNQDNFFIHHKGNVTFYGVADGHGPFGHLVSFRLVQSLPFYLSNSEHFGKDWALALKEAFLSAHKDLCDFCSTHSINIEASGAAGSVLVLEEQTVHIAFIGDARIMLGSWNRRDSRMIFCTKDHKPELPEEKARLEECGSEVREIDPGSYRIYLPGSNFPGLTMSRAFGDTACNGVLREPEYHKFVMQPTDQWYAIVASDGVWEFMEGEEVCSLTAKKLRLKGPLETINFLVNASRKRWNYCCGDYCDDITAILVQWNSDNKESKTNHAVTAKRGTIPEA